MWLYIHIIVHSNKVTAVNSVAILKALERSKFTSRIALGYIRALVFIFCIFTK